MSQEKVLMLTIKKKWYDMILSGEKTAEYRDIKPFWVQRLIYLDLKRYIKEGIKDGLSLQEIIKICDIEHTYLFDDFTHVHLFNGGHFGARVPNTKFECNGITIGVPKPEWSDNAQDSHFIIHLGKKVEI